VISDHMLQTAIEHPTAVLVVWVTLLTCSFVMVGYVGFRLGRK